MVSESPCAEPFSATVKVFQWVEILSGKTEREAKSFERLLLPGI